MMAVVHRIISFHFLLPSSFISYEVSTFGIVQTILFVSTIRQAVQRIIVAVRYFYYFADLANVRFFGDSTHDYERVAFFVLIHSSFILMIRSIRFNSCS